jgi:hypothetical protein
MYNAGPLKIGIRTVAPGEISESTLGLTTRTGMHYESSRLVNHEELVVFKDDWHCWSLEAGDGGTIRSIERENTTV